MNADARPVPSDTAPSVPPRWFVTCRPDERAEIPTGLTLTQAILARARQMPDQVVLADERLGARTYREVFAAVLALRPQIAQFPEPCVGLMFPASVAAGIAYLAALFAGKVPVMVNWTSGMRGLTHGLDRLGIRHVLTAERVLQRVQSQVPGLEALQDRFVLLEAMRRQIPMRHRLAAWLYSRLGLWGALERAPVPETAVVLFTSGSESVPKAVALTHTNLLANLRDLTQAFEFRADDRLIGVLPPFHSFGLTVTLLLPLASGVPVVYHPVPMESVPLARIIAAYRVSILIGTPTFLSSIFRVAADDQLNTLRAIFSGGEKCPDALYDTVARRCPCVRFLEGYGVTECSPVITLSDATAPRRGTIGKLLPSLHHTIRDPETGARVPPGGTGLLYVRGPSVFGGYWHYDGPAPFVEWDGATWYCTGDLVSEAPDGVFTYAGRLRRFVKRGGEMVSLPAIEDVLLNAYGLESDIEPVLAVDSTPDELNPEILLFTVRPLDRHAVNQVIRAAGLSPLHHVREVIRVDRLPTLGAGKTDYRALRDLWQARPKS